MKALLIAATISAMVAGSAYAQTQTPQTSPPPTAPSAPRVAPDAGAPLPGANSFTESQAKARIEQQGYVNVTGLAKDSEGVWRGTATKDGRSHNVAIDFRGNIVVSQN